MKLFRKIINWFMFRARWKSRKLTRRLGAIYGMGLSSNRKFRNHVQKQHPTMYNRTMNVFNKYGKKKK